MTKVTNIKVKGHRGRSNKDSKDRQLGSHNIKLPHYIVKYTCMDFLGRQLHCDLSLMSAKN